MKIHIGNDTSDFHAGSNAVIRALKHIIHADEHDITTTPRPNPCTQQEIQNCDILIINGEGAMQEERKGWDNFRARKLMMNLTYAKLLGKKAWLVNSVWHNMDDVWASVLPMLDGVFVREPGSAKQMWERNGFQPDMYLDLSFSCPLDEDSKFTDYNKETVIGDIYRRNTPKLRRFDHTHRSFRQFPHLGLGGTAIENDISRDWSELVRSLQTAGLYITGQHHGVYAACKARTPFVSFKLYNHKISALLEWAGIDLPIPETRREIFDAIKWAKKNPDSYNRLFDWMEKQPVWPGLVSP